ncbi:MAG TPA: response regulator transcription factor [Thermoleophilaceae bacterium]
MRVVIGEDSVLVREGIARVLTGAGFDVVAEVGDADELVRVVRELKPDVAVVDIRMPPRGADDGLEAARTIRGELPDIGILVLSQYVDEHYVTRLLEDGAEGVGYLLKDRVAETDRFVESVRRVAEGGSALDPEVVSHMVGSRGDGPLSELSEREREVLSRMAEGLSNKAIAAEFGVSERAVEHHVTRIFSKLGLTATGQQHRRVLAVLAYLRG